MCIENGSFLSVGRSAEFPLFTVIHTFHLHLITPEKIKLDIIPNFRTLHYLGIFLVQFPLDPLIS